MAPQVVTECRDAGVTIERRGRQRFGENVVEVAAQLAPQRGRLLARQPVRFFAGRTQVLQRRGRNQAARVHAGEQLVENDAEREDVGRHAEHAGVELLGRGVLRRQRRRAFLREPGAGIVADQARDAEVEQLHPARVVDQDVRRFQVAVDHQLRVRRGHCVEHLREQRHTRAHPQGPRRAPAVDALAAHQLEHQVGLAALGDAGVEQLGDARVLQPRENRALAPETFARFGVEEAGAQQLDRGFAFVVAIGAARTPDAAHAALADHVDERPAAQSFARGHTRRQQRLLGHTTQERHAARGFARDQQRAQLGRRVRLVRGEIVQPALALERRQGQQFVDAGRKLSPAGCVRGRHGPSSLQRAAISTQSAAQQHPTLGGRAAPPSKCTPRTRHRSTLFLRAGPETFSA